MNARGPLTIIVAFVLAGCGQISANAQQRHVEERVERIDPAAITTTPISAERVAVFMRHGPVHVLAPARIVRVPGDSLYVVTLDRRVEELTVPGADVAQVELTHAVARERTGAGASSLAWTPLMIVGGIIGALVIAVIVID